MAETLMDETLMDQAERPRSFSPDYCAAFTLDRTIRSQSFRSHSCESADLDLRPKRCLLSVRSELSVSAVTAKSPTGWNARDWSNVFPERKIGE